MYCACHESLPAVPVCLTVCFFTQRLTGRLLVSPPLGGSTTKSKRNVNCSPLALLVAVKVTGKMPTSVAVPESAPLDELYVMPAGRPTAE
jgi:hypothetical protein